FWLPWLIVGLIPTAAEVAQIVSPAAVRFDIRDVAIAVGCALELYLVHQVFIAWLAARGGPLLGATAIDTPRPKVRLGAWLVLPLAAAANRYGVALGVPLVGLLVYLFVVPILVVLLLQAFSRRTVSRSPRGGGEEE